MNINTSESEAKMNAIFKELFNPLVYFVRNIIINPELSEDIVQDVFLKYWTKFGNKDCHSFAKIYLYRAARNASIDHIRHQKVEKKRLKAYLLFQQEFEVMDDLIAQREIKIRINLAMKRLPNRCLEVFHLSRIEGLTYRQIAQRMDISIKTVETQMSKALRIFRKELKGLY